MKSTPLAIPVATLLMTVPGHEAGAAVLFADPFGGTAGQTITAYDSDYTETNPAQTVYNTIASPGLTYSGLATGGLSANIGGSNAAYQGTIITKWTNDADFTDVTSSQAMYFSFLLNIPATTDLTTGGILGIQFQLSGQRDIKVGVANNGGNLYLGGSRNSTGAWTNYNVNPLVGTTMLVVGSIPAIPDTGYTNPTISLYLNPMDLTTQPGTATATFSGGNTNDGTNLTALSLLSIKAGATNARSFGYIDEVRFGTTWADVVPPIPEPAPALLGGIGLLALLRRRR